MLISIENDTLLPEPTHFPLDMSRFGKNPYGKNLYRLVYAPSVKILVGGEFQDGYIGYRARPAYRHVGPFWILEKWISALEHTGMTERQYEAQFKDPFTGLILTGPYPSQGIYFHCETLSCHPDDANIEWLVSLIEKAKRNDPLENTRAVLASREKQEKAEADVRFDRCKEALPSFGIRAASFPGHVKATKSAPVMKSANELELPVNLGPRVGKRKK